MKFPKLKYFIALLLVIAMLGPRKGDMAVAAELFDINFSNMALEDVVKTYAKWMGKNFLLTDKLKSGAITTYSERKVTKDEAWLVFEAILRANGYTIVPGKEINRIVPVADSVSDLVPTYSTDGLTYGSGSFSYVTRLFPLEHVSATEIKGVIQKFLSKGADIMDYPPTNLLIITESSAHINRVIKILKELDVPSTEQMIEILEVKHAAADEMASLLENVMGAGGGGGAAAPGPRRGAIPQPAGAPGAAASAGRAARLIPVERTNSIIVVGSKKDIEEVKRLLAMLDVDVEGSGSAEESIYVHYLDYADATEIAGTLNSLITGAAAQNQATSRQGSGGSSLQRSSSQRQTQTLQSAQAAVAGRSLVTPGAPGGPQAGGLAAKFEADIRIVADTPTNSLLITATRRDYETIKKVIEKLDRPRRQVFVEAAILEVLANDASSLGFSAFGANKLSDGGVLFGQQSLGSPPSPADAAALAAAGQGLGSLGPLSGGVLGPTEGIDLDGDGTDDVNIPTYGGLISAAKSNFGLNVLSTPTVLTSDNEQAQIIIANNVPIPTGQTVGTSGVTTATISREDIGITLRITPQINEGDTLRLEIFVEVSNVAQGSFGIDVSQSGIVTTVRSAETVVSVKDRQPIVIGGLIQDTDSLNENKIPILGDIPILGALFRSREKSKDKQNLIILLTPNIVRDHFDATRVMALEVERRKPILENDVLREWLETKNTESAIESFRRPPQEDRLPHQLDTGEILITPQGVYTPETYTPPAPPPAENDKDDENPESGAVGPIRGLKKSESGAEGSSEALPAGATPPAENAAAPEVTTPQQAVDAIREALDPEEIRKQILEERQRRQQEREERLKEQQQ